MELEIWLLLYEVARNSFQIFKICEVDSEFGDNCDVDSKF